jgi:transaldolase
MRVKIFCDAADLEAMKCSYDSGHVSGFTTNPTLMKRSGVTNYREFAEAALREFPGVPISFEVFSDELPEMKAQALKLSSMGPSVYVKIPFMNTKGIFTLPLITELTDIGVKLNITAVMTVDQVRLACEAISPGVPSVVSVFAGRIADCGYDPEPVIKNSRKITGEVLGCELLWASPREVFNVYQAEELGCDIITCTPEILAKLHLRGKDLDLLSLETVRMFHIDAVQAGFSL